jgi:hypothetical protein
VAPPHTRDVERIVRFQIGNLLCCHRLTETREFLKIRFGKIDEADLLTGQIEIEGAWIQVFNLFRREDGKAAIAY